MKNSNVVSLFSQGPKGKSGIPGVAGKPGLPGLPGVDVSDNLIILVMT